MKQWIYDFVSKEDFSKFVKDNGIDLCKELLVQVNCGTLDLERYRYIQSIICKELPNAVVVGSSSSSQLYNGNIYAEKIILSITCFNKSSLDFKEYDLIENREIYDKVVLDLKNSIKVNTKGILLITNGIYFDNEKFVQKINENFSHIPIFGGIASGSELYSFTIFSKNKIYATEGLLAVIFNGDDLKISCDYNFDWEPLGKEYTVTKAKGRHLYELNNSSIYDVYQKYFGSLNTDEMLNISLSHPLIHKTDDFGEVARALLMINSKKGLFTGSFKEGEKVRITFGNYKKMLDRYSEIRKNYTLLTAEALWYYVCVSYNFGYKDILKNLTSIFLNKNQIYMFATFGEFSHKDGKNLFLNFTLTRVAISEEENAKIEMAPKMIELSEKDRLLTTLSTLVSSSSNEIVELNRGLEKEVQKRTKELVDLNETLEKRIELEVKKNREKDKMLYHQSKLASMGEMINNIAHQWRQPLNIIALAMQDLSLKSQIGDVTYADIVQTEKKISETLKYLSNTIDDFRSFVSQGENFTNSGSFEVCKTIKDTIRLISIVLKDEKIDLKLKLPKMESLVKGSSNDLKQVLLNFIYNAIDVLKEKKVKDPTIKIEVRYNRYINITVKDNGGGIEHKIIDKIFEPYFTTKYKARGTGLGLYMSKMIIEKRLNGEIKVRNTSRGAMFWIELPIMA